MNEKEFIDWLVDYILWHDEDEDLCAEVICRKLVKVGALKRETDYDDIIPRVYYVKAKREKSE